MTRAIAVLALAHAACSSDVILTIHAPGNGLVISDPAGIYCGAAGSSGGSQCSVSLPHGTQIGLQIYAGMVSGCGNVALSPAPTCETGTSLHGCVVTLDDDVTFDLVCAP